MATKKSASKTTQDFAGLLGGFLAVLSLLIVAYYFYLHRSQPNHGFVLHGRDGTVLQVKTPCPDDGSVCLQVEDKVIKIGDVLFQSYVDNDNVAIYRPFKSGRPVPVEFERNGQRLTVEIEAIDEVRGILPSFFAFAFPLLFWIMGTIAVVFLRPRDERWLLLVLFQFDTALWISSGMLTYSHEAYSMTVFLVAIVMFLPLSVHLHLILPDSPFQKYHRWILVPLYAIAVVLIVLIQWRVLPRFSFYITAVAAMLISLGLLVVRLFLPAPPPERVARRIMLYGVGIGLGPITVLTLIYYLNPVRFLGFEFIELLLGVFLAIAPIWPFTYIYAIYKHDLGTFEFRGNRLLGAYGFFASFVTVYIFSFTRLVERWAEDKSQTLVGFLFFSLVCVAASPPLYSRFQRLIDRHVFGLKYLPNEIVGVFAEKIPTAFNIDILKRVIVDEIVPTLMIRQSAMYLYRERDGVVEVVYEQGVPAADCGPDEQTLRALAEKAGRFISFTLDKDKPFGWVRLVLPLSIPDEAIGIWLLGKRDPDDYYPRSDVQLLNTLANQIGPVIANFRLVEKARQEVAENRRLQAQLVHSQKMEAIGRLSAGVAHDFNNILSVIIGYSNLVLAQYRDDAGLRQSVTNIKDAGERAAGLTKQLLAFSRQQVMEAQVASVNSIVGDVEKMLRRLTGEDIELTTSLGPDLPSVKIDPGQMGQVIINLAVNARDAMPDGGKITISTREVTCGREGEGDCHEGVPDGSYVLLTVADTGSGIEPDVQLHMFEPYFTTKELGKGTGLGLSMVYGIISQSKGVIFVDSEIEQGTVFSIYLPAVSEAEIAQQEVKGVRGVSASGSETVLLVEDEESVRTVTCEILQANGYTVIEAQDGPQAIAEFEQHRGDIDLLLTDVVMPHMKGPELAERLFRLEPELKVIYMSGYNEEAILGQRFGESGSVLIHKPFSPQALAGRVRDVLDRKDVTS